MVSGTHTFLRGRGARFVALLGTIALAGCGANDGLKPAPGQALPVAPTGARATPTPIQLLTPDTQARPQRSDDLLRQSDPRKGDEFDLPPGNAG